MRNETIRLAVKDFQIQASSVKNYIITLLVFLAVFLLISPMQYQAAFSMASLITLYRFINSTLYEDEKNNTLRLIDSLPVGRETVVKARYLSTGILAIVLMIIIELQRHCRHDLCRCISSIDHMHIPGLHHCHVRLHAHGVQTGIFKGSKYQPVCLYRYFHIIWIHFMLIGSLGTRQGVSLMKAP